MRLNLILIVLIMSIAYGASTDKHTNEFETNEFETNEFVSHLNRFLQVYLLSMKEDQKEIGKMQFKLYKGPKVTCVIDYILIEEDKRHQGNGDILLETALSKMQTLGCDVIETQVDADNVASLALFEKKGFVRQAVKPHMLGHAIRLQKKITK